MCFNYFENILNLFISHLSFSYFVTWLGGEANMNNLFEYDQGDFFQISQPSSSSMDNIGYVYIPTRF